MRSFLTHGGRPSRRPEGARTGFAPRSGERGQAIVLFAVCLAVLCGAVAIVLDQGLLRKANQDLWNSLDAGALAGVHLLPGDGANAESVALEYVDENFPSGSPSDDVDVSFRCLIGSVAGSPRLTDVPAVCDPGSGVSWTCNTSVCTAMCDPSAGDTCNTIVVASPTAVDYNFGPVLDVFGGQVATKQSAACKGPCGQAPDTPVDVMLVMDRTSSMNGVDTENARAAADSVRRAYDPTMIRLGLSMLGPSRTDRTCKTDPASSIGTANYPTDLPRWMPLGLTGIGGPVNENYTHSTSALGRAIACFTNSSTRTDIADPMRAAIYELNRNGRANATKAILLFSDGEPNVSTTGTPNYCQEAVQAADAAKLAGIRVITVGFGIDGANNRLCIDTSGPWVGKWSTTMLATMATDSVEAGCPGTSNDDGDNFYCLPRSAGASTDLSNVFRAAIGSVIGETRLVLLP
jgi:Flp pilus assembly protein TadG